MICQDILDLHRSFNFPGMSSPYNTNENARMLNAADPAFRTANSQGYSAIVEYVVFYRMQIKLIFSSCSIEEIYDDWPAGVSGYISKLR